MYPAYQYSFIRRENQMALYLLMASNYLDVWVGKNQDEPSVARPAIFSSDFTRVNVVQRIRVKKGAYRLHWPIGWRQLL